MRALTAALVDSFMVDLGMLSTKGQHYAKWHTMAWHEREIDSLTWMEQQH
jgi:hypothetical protein